MAVNARKMCKVSCVTLKKNLPAVVFLVWQQSYFKIMNIGARIAAISGSQTNTSVSAAAVKNSAVEHTTGRRTVLSLHQRLAKATPRKLCNRNESTSLPEKWHRCTETLSWLPQQQQQHRFDCTSGNEVEAFMLCPSWRLLRKTPSICPGNGRLDCRSPVTFDKRHKWIGMHWSYYSSSCNQVF